MQNNRRICFGSFIDSVRKLCCRQSDSPVQDDNMATAIKPVVDITCVWWTKWLMCVPAGLMGLPSSL